MIKLQLVKSFDPFTQLMYYLKNLIGHISGHREEFIHGTEQTEDYHVKTQNGIEDLHEERQQYEREHCT